MRPEDIDLSAGALTIVEAKAILKNYWKRFNFNNDIDKALSALAIISDEAEDVDKCHNIAELKDLVNTLGNYALGAFQLITLEQYSRRDSE